MGVTFVKGEAIGFETEEMLVTQKIGVVDNGYQKLKRVHVCFKFLEKGESKRLTTLL